MTMTKEKEDAVQAHKLTESPTAEPDFNGGAIIDDQGAEIPITEEMVQVACDELGDDETQA